MNISNKIPESFRLKTKSEQLLSLAKRAVEIAIEEEEDGAAVYTERIVHKKRSSVGYSSCFTQEYAQWARD
jgi:hypothetical protein